jgi:hypothetical protein
MIKSKAKVELRRHVHNKSVIRMSGLGALFGCAIIAVCCSVTFAQNPTVIAVAPAEATATRQRKSIDDAPKNITSAAGIDRRAVSDRRVFVRSTSLLVRGAVVEDKLLKRPEFKQLGFVITRDGSEADLILELRHDLFTMYVFSVVDNKTGLVLASRKLSSVGGTVAGKVAKRFVKEMSRLP